MLRFFLVTSVAALIGYACIDSAHPVDSPWLAVLSVLTGYWLLAHLRPLWWFIQILTPRTNGEHPLAPALAAAQSSATSGRRQNRTATVPTVPISRAHS
jgi:hypothetical protein